MKPKNCRKCGKDVEQYFFKSHKKHAAYWFIYGWRCTGCGCVYGDEDARTGVRPKVEKEVKQEKDKDALKEAYFLKDIFKITATLGHTDYYEYIESETWKKRRRKIMLMNPTCVLCGRKAEIVHHRTYIHLGGEKEKKDLISLCKKCHHFFHQYHWYDRDSGTFRRTTNDEKRNI